MFLFVCFYCYFIIDAQIPRYSFIQRFFSADPCLHGGVCTNQFGGHSYSCTKGCSEKNCEIGYCDQRCILMLLSVPQTQLDQIMGAQFLVSDESFQQ